MLATPCHRVLRAVRGVVPATCRVLCVCGLQAEISQGLDVHSNLEGTSDHAHPSFPGCQP